eukprot:6825472-Alexandrium_andersonii.AAC.1
MRSPAAPQPIASMKYWGPVRGVVADDSPSAAPLAPAARPLALPASACGPGAAACASPDPWACASPVIEQDPWALQHAAAASA